MKRIVSLLLCAALLTGLIPGVFAAEGDPYLALGDSITAGAALNEGERAFPEILAEENGWELTNLGLNGQTAGSLLEQIRTGSCDDVIAEAEIITITAGGNDVLDALYELIAQEYNVAFDPDITAEDVIPIMLEPEDERWFWLMMKALTVLNGGTYSGTLPFAEREEFLAKVDEFSANLREVTAYIRNLNPDAIVIVPTQYNPYKDFADMYESVGSGVDAGALILNAAIADNADDCGYLVADVYTAFRDSTEQLCNASMDPMNLDFHPNARGHEVIAQVIQEVIDGIPEKPQPAVNPFSDVKETDYFYESVLWALQQGITTGATETTFDPSGNLQRAQVVTMLWRAAGQPMPTTAENPFTDVSESDWYYSAVLWAVEQGITNGISGTEFGPYGVTNRAQAVTFLWRWHGQPGSGVSNSFTDVVSGAWYEAPINWAVEHGITNGMGDGTFGIGADCNRAQAVTFLYRAEQ